MKTTNSTTSNKSSAPPETICFSFSPAAQGIGYFLGVIKALRETGMINDTTQIVGSSSGAISAVTIGFGVSDEDALAMFLRCAARCRKAGRVKGKILPIFMDEMDKFVTEEMTQALLKRPMPIGIAYRKIFPTRKNVLKTKFEDYQDIHNAVARSATLPFYATGKPCRVEWSMKLGVIPVPRMYIDGYFTVDRERFGCPEPVPADDILSMNDREDISITKSETALDWNDQSLDTPGKVGTVRTVAILAFPQRAAKATAFDADRNCISPSKHRGKRYSELALMPATDEELLELFDEGYENGIAWAQAELESRQ